MATRIASSTWNFHKLGSDEVIEKTASLGVDGIELIAHAPYHVDSRWPDEKIQGLKRRCAELGLAIAAVSPATDYLKFTDDERAAMIQHTKEQVDLTAKLDASVCRIFSGGNVPEGRTWQECVDTVIAGLRPCAEYAQQKGVRLAVESHGKFGCDLEALHTILTTVNSPALGVTLDTANFYHNGVDPVEAAKRLAKWIYHTHLKDGALQPQPHGTGLGEGEVDLAGCIAVLKRNGYDGWWCLEYEGSEDPNVGVPKSLKVLRDLLS